MSLSNWEKRRREWADIIREERERITPEERAAFRHELLGDGLVRLEREGVVTEREARWIRKRIDSQT